MKDLIEFPLEDGGSIIVEVNQSPGAATRASISGGTAEKAKGTFEAALAPVTSVAQAFVDKLQNLERRPDEFTVEFGIKFSGKLNTIIASSSGEANIRVTMTWNAEAAENLQASPKRS